MNSILPKIPGDGFIETGRRTRFGRNFASYYWLLVDQASEFTVVARDVAGNRVTAKLDGVLSADRDKSNNSVNARMQANLSRLDGPKDNVSIRFLHEPDVAYLRIRAFEGESYTSAIDSAFKTLLDKDARALILDLRGNGGGVDEWGASLVSHLVDKPFRYFDHIHVATIHPSFATWKPSTFDELRDGTVPDPAGGYLVSPKLHSGVAEQAPAPHPFLGKLIVMMDGGTFSTSADVTATLRNLARATFVGEESAGAYEGNTSGLNALIILPNSRLRVKVQMYGYVNAATVTKKGRGTLPDYVVKRRVADLLNGTDPALDRAVALAKARSRPKLSS